MLDSHDASAVVYTESTLPAELRSAQTTTFVDLSGSAATALAELVPPVAAAVTAEPDRFVHYPWRGVVVRLPGPLAYRRLRLDRNRNKLTFDEQNRASALRIGIVGLSVGHAIALTLALEGLVGELRLADFDELEITNLNRVPATVVDVGVNKAIVAARRLAEIDPYLPTAVYPDGVTADNIDEFLDGLDLVIEECDSFDIKVRLREKCRESRIPVIMETSDGGTLDVERYDLEPTRPLFHGLAGDLRADDLADLDRGALTLLAVRVLQPQHVTAPMAASALELGQTISAWPQLGGDVLLGGATVAAAIRRLVQGRPLPSGRVRFDRDGGLDDLTQPEISASTPASAPAGTTQDLAALADAAFVAALAARAPSPGNQQPWQITTDGSAVRIALDPARTSILDIAHRASLVTLGTAVRSAEIAAAARGRFGGIDVEGTGPHLTARVRLTETAVTATESDQARLTALLSRATRRDLGDASELTDDDTARLVAAAATGTTRAVVITGEERAAFGSILARSDRIRFLTPALHREMFTELTDDPTAPTGIQISSLALPPAMAGMIDVLRRPDVMALLDRWDGGAILGADAAGRVASASAILMLVHRGRAPADYLHAGRVALDLWLTAQDLGFAVHPMTPTFFYALDDAETRALSANRGDELVEARADLLGHWPLAADETPTIALRISRLPTR
ncbi:MAG: Rv1355c family protein [Gordonia sp. (in: high G+C Gram-positive bacteria)]